jgi:membrane-associated phospholipid phosphatase
MTLEKITPPYTSFNPWFLIPFALWLVFGGIALLAYDQQVLFATFNTHHTMQMDVLMVYITRMGEGVFGAIILAMILTRESFRNWWYFSAAVLCNLLPALLTQYIKSAINAPRPLNVFKDADWIHYVPEWDRLLERSFPSGHTCSGFSLFCFLAFILTPKYKWLALVCFALAMLVGYSRMYLAAHFFLDVYVGSIIGVVFTILVVSLMRRYPHYFYRRRKSETA